MMIEQGTKKCSTEKTKEQPEPRIPANLFSRHKLLVHFNIPKYKIKFGTLFMFIPLH